jgi:hypothetical protein
MLCLNSSFGHVFLMMNNILCPLTKIIHSPPLLFAYEITGKYKNMSIEYSTFLVK